MSVVDFSPVKKTLDDMLLRCLLYGTAGFGFLLYLFWPKWFRRYKKVGYVSELFMYPVTSCEGIAVNEVVCARNGLEKGAVRDREFVVVICIDENCNEQFLSTDLAKIIPVSDGRVLMLSAPHMPDIKFRIATPNSVRFILPSKPESNGSSREPSLFDDQKFFVNGCGQEECGVDCGNKVSYWLNRYFCCNNLRLYRRNDFTNWRQQGYSISRHPESLYREVLLSNTSGNKTEDDETEMKTAIMTDNYSDSDFSDEDITFMDEDNEDTSLSPEKHSLYELSSSQQNDDETSRLGVITVHNEASMKKINRLFQIKPPMTGGKFRANIVISGCEAFAELGWEQLYFGNGATLKVRGPDIRFIEPPYDKKTDMYRGEAEPLDNIFDKWCLPATSLAQLVGVKTTMEQVGEVKVGDPVYAYESEEFFT